jgi:CRP/FNR family cyclic AMP-dependent transcriptional regulator
MPSQAITAIRACTAFRDLAELEGGVERLAELGEVRNFDNGHFLLCSGQAATDMHIILSGDVAIELIDDVGTPLRVETLSEGDVLGWSWLFPGGCWQFDVLALGKVRTLTFEGDALRQLCDDAPVFGYTFMRDLVGIFSNRLMHTRMRIVENMI